MIAALLHANLALACAVLAVLAARKPVRRAFGARASYGLWLAVPLVTAAVLLPKPEAPTPLSPVAETVTAAAFEAVPVEVAPSFDWNAVAVGLWIAGAVLAAALMALRQVRFMAEVRAGRAGPAVVGALRPRIVTPADFEARFAPAERDVILSHEAVHLAAGDARVNALSAALTCLCWFNPLAHLGAHLMRIDQELACDAAVLARHPQARRLYAEALLKTQLTTQPLPLGCHWPSAADHPLKERIVMLKAPLPAPARRIAGAAVVAAAACTAAVAAWAAQPGLEPADAQKLVGPGQGVLCKPDANRELHDCRIVATPWAKIATAADVAAAFPAYEKARGLTADVFLQCAPAGDRLAGCKAKKVYPDQPLPAGSEARFEAAAVQVAGLYRIKAEAKIPSPMFMTIQFRAEPAMPGDPHTGKIPTHAPDALPMPPRKAMAEEPATITNPVWLEKPTAADIARLYPAETANRGISAEVVITCRVGPDGRMASCRGVRSEARGPNGPAPEADMDFGTATLQLAKLFRMEVGPGVIGGVVRIPVRWMPSKHVAATPVVERPVWLEKPTAEQMTELFPKELASAAKNVVIRSRMTCHVGGDGRLRDCVVGPLDFDSDSVSVPHDYKGDFGMSAAMLKVATYFRMERSPLDGDGIVVIPIIWRGPGA